MVVGQLGGPGVIRLNLYQTTIDYCSKDLALQTRKAYYKFWYGCFCSSYTSTHLPPPENTLANAHTTTALSRGPDLVRGTGASAGDSRAVVTPTTVGQLPQSSRLGDVTCMA